MKRCILSLFAVVLSILVLGNEVCATESYGNEAAVEFTEPTGWYAEFPEDYEPEARTLSGAELSAESVYNAMMAMQAQYPEGTPYTNANFYQWKGGYYYGGYGCAGFAFMLSDAAFGDLPARFYYDYSQIRVGDILRINNDTHSVIVLEVHESYVVVAEGNYDFSVHWGRKISMEKINDGSTTHAMTRYPEGVDESQQPESDGEVCVEQIQLDLVEEEDGSVELQAVVELSWTAGTQGKRTEARWLLYEEATGAWRELQGWETVRAYSSNTTFYDWLFWEPDQDGSYLILVEARIEGQEEVVSQHVGYVRKKEGIDYSNVAIKGKCQMPYTGEGGGYLIGVETTENPEQKLQFELLILDCTLLAEGKDAWIWTTGKCSVAEGNAFWAIWQPEYGYYWTLFRVYDENGNLLAEECYGFENIC